MWLGLAAQRNEGRVVTIENDPARASWAEAYFRQAEMSGVCAVRRGDALTLMRGMEESFDLIFLDVLTQFSRADTALQLLELCVMRLKPRGVLLSDNAFRGGGVLNLASAHPSTQGIADFNRAIANHPRLTTTFIPMRDGVSMSVKVG
jgi:caffeoyl-CoA O-methyltransferase